MGSLLMGHVRAWFIASLALRMDAETGWWPMA
jgi:hypothetical protein